MAKWCSSAFNLLVLILPSMCRGIVDHNIPLLDGNKLLIGKSWGLPLELKCEDIESPHIKVSGITLAHKANTVTAEEKYPGIQVKAQRSCDRTTRLPTGYRPAECSIDLPQLSVPTNEMVVAVFWCYSGVSSPVTTAKQRTASSKRGDVTVKCNSKDIIRIQEIHMGNEPVDDFNTQKRTCLNEMMKSVLPKNEQGPKPKWASCSIKRKGRTGDLKVKYSCDSPPKHARHVSEPQPVMYPMPPSD